MVEMYVLINKVPFLDDATNNLVYFLLFEVLQHFNELEFVSFLKKQEGMCMVEMYV